MKGKNPRKRGSGPGPKRNKFSINEDPFFSKKRRKRDYEENDGEIQSEESEEEENGVISGDEEEGGEEGEEFMKETVDEMRHRMAKEYVEKLRAIARKEEEENEGEEEQEKEYEKEGERDSSVAKHLMKQQLEESGRLRRAIASR